MLQKSTTSFSRDDSLAVRRSHTLLYQSVRKQKTFCCCFFFRLHVRSFNRSHSGMCTTTVIAQDWAIKLYCLILLIRFRWIGMCRSLLLHAQRTKGKGRTQRSNERDILESRLLLLLIFIHPSVMRYGLIMMMMMGACNGIASPSGGVMMTAFVSFPRCIFPRTAVGSWIGSILTEMAGGEETRGYLTIK